MTPRRKAYLDDFWYPGLQAALDANPPIPREELGLGPKPEAMHHDPQPKETDCVAL